MKTKEIKLTNGKTATGIEIPLQNGSLVLIKATKGFIMCGYLDIEAANRFGDCAAIVKGIKTVDDMLNNKIVAVSKCAADIGIKEGMGVMQALTLLV